MSASCYSERMRTPPSTAKPSASSAEELRDEEGGEENDRHQGQENQHHHAEDIEEPGVRVTAHDPFVVRQQQQDREEQRQHDAIEDVGEVGDQGKRRAGDEGS